ncbi:hypothetical protein HCC36_16000 [Listeria booriae]|uniref:Uncharacterized protein n=1 Tax=Listeria booriae TaxID=1552123 RepID=A0A842G6R4_9LIST|nr:hypothetical protein [Listeria booriae]MBC2294726.1 hypothetical protein [Listeria booriae]
MRKMGNVLLMLFLIFATIFSVVSWQKSQDVEKGNRKQAKINSVYKEEIKEQATRIATLSKIADSKKNEEKNALKSIDYMKDIKEILLQNERVLKALFTYDSLENRNKSLGVLVTDELKVKMQNANSDTDSHEGGIQSSYIDSKVFLHMDNANFSTWNTVKSKVNEQTLLVYVQIDYLYQQGRFVVTNLLFKAP